MDRGSMSHTLTLEQASAQLPALVRSLSPGDEIVLTDNEKPVARILPSEQRQAGRRFVHRAS